MDTGTAVELVLLETPAIWPLGFYVWLPSMPMKEEANTDNILGHMEEEAIYREGSDSDHKSRLPESEENHGNISIKVEENTMESDVARCSHTEQLQSPMFQVSFGGDQVMIKCEEECLEHSFDAGNHSRLFHPWADEDQHSSHFNNIMKGIKEEPRDENEPVVEVEGSPAGNQENGESYAVVKVNVEEDKQVCGRDQLLMHVKEEPANHPHPSCDNYMDLLADEASRGPGAFPVASSSPSLDAPTGCPNWVLLSHNELAEAVTQQVGERLDKDVKALLLPLEAKCSDLRAALRQNRHKMAQLGKQLSDLTPKEHRKKSQAQDPLTRVKDTPEEDSHISAPVSRLGTSHNPGGRKKHRHRHHRTLWNEHLVELQKTVGKYLQENLNVQHAGSAVTSAVTRIADHQGQLDSNEAAEDGYQHDRLEVRRVAVAECQRNHAEVHGPTVARPRRKRTVEVLQPRCRQDSPENRIPCDVELPPGIPYNPDSFWDAPYSIWMD
ncbi:uncharacterized protein [Dermacentor andersoni]|uniref:uncharacterized protein isoform X2 n=1 Tax=Dermacentor andersoni TaxID=34620 RepID=UPI0024161B70|nr:uncharacterized protein LOC126529226 isoform X2 [Dermacentor andersoni]